MKKKTLFSSILTIALCLCLIAGSTFALFTSESTVSISVTAGKVEMIASVDALELYSVAAKEGGEEVDEKGNTYEYVKQDGAFANTGTAVFDEATATMTIDRITPGDKVTFNVTGANNSDVKVLYRYKVACSEGFALMSGLVVTIDGEEYESMSSFTSPWAELAAKTAMENVAVAIELPVAAGNEYQELTTKITVTVEAVQANAKVEDNTEPVVTYIEDIVIVDNKEDALAAIADNTVKYVAITEDIADQIVVDADLTNKTIDADGNDVSFDFNGNLENVVVTGIVAENGRRAVDVVGATGDITIVDCTLISGVGTSASAIGHGPNVNVTVDRCNISAVAGKTYAMYYSGSSGSLIITNSTFGEFGSWTITSNSTINGDVVIDNCVFNTKDGVFKTLGGGITGDFTFTNNTMNGCYGHDGTETNPKLNNLVVSGSGPVVCGGTKTVSGNIRNGEAWTQE